MRWRERKSYESCLPEKVSQRRELFHRARAACMVALFQFALEQAGTEVERDDRDAGI